jgi:hypothetical protein
MVVTSIVVGRLITRTGRYNVFVVGGTLIMCVGYILLSQLGYGSTQNDLRLDLIVVGLGLEALLQTYTLIVQNAVGKEDLGWLPPPPSSPVRWGRLSVSPSSAP